MLFLIFAKSSFANRTMEDRYVVKHYTTKNGLLQNSINSLVIDAKGALWIATFGGLTRFDGQEFSHYIHANSALASDRIMAVVLGKDKQVYVMVSRPNERLYYVDQNNLLRKVNKGLFSIAAYPRTSLFDPQSLLAYRNHFSDIRTLPPGMVFEESKAVPVNENRFYYFKKDTLMFIDRPGGTQREMNVPGIMTGFMIAGDLLAFDAQWNYSLWENGVRVRQVNTAATFQKLIRTLKAGTASVNKARLFGTDQKSIQVSIGKELWEIFAEHDTLQARLLLPDMDIHAQVSAIYHDRNNRLFFIGTNTDGLYILGRNQFSTIVFDDGNTVRNNVYSQIKLDDSTFMNWYCVYRKDGTVLKQFDKPLLGSGFARTTDGSIWYATRDHLYAVDRSLATRRKIVLPPGRNNVAGVMQEDAQQRLWFATRNSLGLVSDSGAAFVWRDTSYAQGDYISDLFFPDSETIWMGCADGILVFDKGTRTVSNCLMKGIPVTSIFRASDSSIWVTTYGKGVYKMKDGRFMGVKANLELLFAHCIIEDKKGFFWFPTNSGLVQCRKKDLDDHGFSGADHTPYYFVHKNIGAHSDEFNSGAHPGFISAANRFYLPTIQGVVSFNPDDIRAVLPNGEIMIRKILVDGNDHTHSYPLTIPPGSHRIEVEISAPYFGEKENNILEYQLKEVSRQWFPVVANKVVCENIESGRYDLKIRKRTGFEDDAYVYKTIHFNVLPFWYERPLIWILTGIFSIALVLALVYRRIASLKKSRALLSRLVSERTLALESKLMELDIFDEELHRVNALQEQAISIILHDIRTPLKFLSSSAIQFNERFSLLGQEEVRKYSSSLVQSATNINKLAEELVAWLIHEKKSKDVHEETIDLVQLLDEVKALYDPIAAAYKSVIHIRRVEVSNLVSDRNKLKLIVRNVIDNAVKHCGGGTIAISVLQHEASGQVAIIVEDNGLGMPPSTAGPVTAGNDLQRPLEKNKLGLSMVSYFMNQLGGAFHIDTEKGKKTVVQLLLPLRSKGPDEAP